MQSPDKMIYLNNNKDLHKYLEQFQVSKIPVDKTHEYSDKINKK